MKKNQRLILVFQSNSTAEGLRYLSLYDEYDYSSSMFEDEFDEGEDVLAAHDLIQDDHGVQDDPSSRLILISTEGWNKSRRKRSTASSSKERESKLKAA